MPRALRGIVRFLLAIAVVVPAPLASAQFLSRFRRQPTPVQKGRQEVNSFLSDERQRLAEMQVELALLGDLATFPYEFTPRANGNTLELRGHVPNEMIRQRAMDVARNTTFLRGIDALRIQPNLSVRSTLRPPGVVQQEGMELLHKEYGPAASQMSLEVRPNGIVVLTGRTDCVESKVEISRLFRRLPGCNAVVNQLTIDPILLDGQRMVRVTHNNMLLVPPSALGQGVGTLLESPPPPPRGPQKETPLPVDRKPAATAPAPLRTSSLSAREGELRLPAAVAQKPPSTPTKPATEKIGKDWEAFAPSKLPVKWGRPAGSWEAQTKELEALHSQPAPKPAKLEWSPQSPHPPNEIVTPIKMAGRPYETKWMPAPAAVNKPGNTNPRSPKLAETRDKPESIMTWRRTGGSEEAEPKEGATATEPRASQVGAATVSERFVPSPLGYGSESSGSSPGNSTPPVSSVRSARRWPPAYVTAPSPIQGRPGLISFDDDPPPQAKPAPTVMAVSRSPASSKPAPAVMTASRSSVSSKPAPAVTTVSRSSTAELSTPRPAVPTAYRSRAAAELQRKVKWLCGRHAREVTAIVQKDGIVLVRVRVADLAVEEKLSPKILSLPEMNSPDVRLMIEVGP